MLKKEKTTKIKCKNTKLSEEVQLPDIRLIIR